MELHISSVSALILIQTGNLKMVNLAGLLICWLHATVRFSCNETCGSSVTGLDKQFFQRKIVNIFLPIIFSICFGCSKDPSQHLIETVLLCTHNNV